MGHVIVLIMRIGFTESANLVARRVRDSLANDGKEPKLSVSVGVAIYPIDFCINNAIHLPSGGNTYAPTEGHCRSVKLTGKTHGNHTPDYCARTRVQCQR
jgi:hypothetical protein